MQNIELAMKDELASRSDAVALACMDTASGLLLGLQMRGGVAAADLELAAYSAAELCSAPGMDDCAEDQPCDDSFVASAGWVHAFARVPNQRDLVVVGLAHGDANVGLLRDWIRQVAERVVPAG